MAKRQAAKTSKGDRNSDRKNGKAFKSGNRGSRGTNLTEIQKVLLGGGALKRKAK